MSTWPIVRRFGVGYSVAHLPVDPADLRERPCGLGSGVDARNSSEGRCIAFAHALITPGCDGEDAPFSSADL